MDQQDSEGTSQQDSSIVPAQQYETDHRPQTTGHRSQTTFRVLIAGGGTGGHVIPALAIARELRESHKADVQLIGTARGLEARLVPEAGFPLHLVQVGQLNQVSLATRMRTMTGLPASVFRCAALLRTIRPHVVLGVGGYASGPAMLAALMLRIPMIAYEPNAVPGMVNRRIGRFVANAAVAYPETARYFRRAEVTGVPIRDEIARTGPLQLQPPRLLITAGSNGAKIFNDTMPSIARDLLRSVPGLQIVHQTGERAFDATRAAYLENGLTEADVEIRAFLTDMPRQLKDATLVLARSGSTVAELSAAGRPSLLVPFPLAADDHQTRNAEAMVKLGAAELLPQAELTREVLLTRLRTLLLDTARLQRMSDAARAGSKPDALRRIGQMLAAFRPA